MSEFGQVIKARRKKCKLNQKEFAESLAVSQSYLSMVETGKENPTDMFKKLFFALYGLKGDVDRG